MTPVRGLVAQIGLRHLRERGLRIRRPTAAGIAAGVALLFSIEAMNSVLLSAVNSTATAFAGHATLEVSAATPGGLKASAASAISRVPGVQSAAPVLEVRSHISGRGAFVLGVTPDIVAVASGTIRGDATAPGVILSSALAASLHASVGDTVGVETPTGPAREHVVGLVSSPALNRIDGGMVALMDLATAQKLFARAGRIDLVLVVARPHTAIAPLRAAVAAVVSGAGSVTTPGGAPGASSQNVNPFVLLTDTIGLISLFVALVLVFNTVSMAMAERRRELSMARAFGATPRQLFAAVVLEAAVLGVAGTLLGLIAGGALATALLRVAGHAYRTVLPVDAPGHVVFRPLTIVLTAVAGMAVAILGAVVPARRALRAAPIDALRPVAPYEWASPAEMARGRVLSIVGVALVAVGAGLGALTRSTTPPPALAGIAVVAILGGVTLLLPTVVPMAARGVAAVLRRGHGAVGRAAGDALRTNPRRTSFTAATLILPLAAVVGLGTAFGSAQTKFHSRAQAFISTPLIVEADSTLGYTATQPLPDTDATKIAAVPGVRAVLGSENTFLTLGARQVILYAIGLRAGERAGVADVLRDATLSAQPAAFRAGLDRGQIAASLLAARDEHLHIGSTIALPTPNGAHVFTVAALFDDLAGEDTFYIDRDTYASVWGDHGVFRFDVVPAPGVAVPALAARLTAAIDRTGIPAVVKTRTQATHQLDANLGQILSIARAIQVAALIVAALSLASTAFTTVLERRWTFGLQRTLGMSRKQIARTLLLEAGAIGVIGSVGAAVIGLAIGTLLVGAFGGVVHSSMPLTIPWTLLALSALAAVVISIGATLYPCRLARRAPIIESLRFE